jgi:hypothetical protein
MRARSNSVLARPYMDRLSVFNRLNRPLRLAVAPWLCQCVLHCAFVLAQCLCKKPHSENSAARMSQPPLYRLPEVLEQMETVGDLPRLRTPSRAPSA